MIKELLKIVNIHSLLPDEHIEAETSTFSKGSIITAQSSIENYIYLIKKGGVKVSYFNEIDEYILDFWFENDFFTSYVSFIQRSPSITQVTALNEVIVERIHHDHLEEFYKKYPIGNEIGRKMAERMYVHKTMKEIELISLTAEQRYINLLEKSQNLIREVSIKEIASYLGIHPEILSRIRRKVIT